MFPRRAELKKKFHEMVNRFHQKEATSPDTAKSAKELGLPSEFEWLMKGPLGRLGVFVEVDDKYYVSEERAKEVEAHFEKAVGDLIAELPIMLPPMFRHWIRHTASVPKGFLRYHALKLLKESPVSGSEIMSEIEKETDGRWKPSPGSVYPLLAWLQDNGYTRGVPAKERGMKCYKLTEKGERFLEEQSKLKEQLQEKLEYFTPSFFGGFGFGPHAKKLRKLREPVGRFIKALINLRIALEENLTEQSLSEVETFLNSTIEKIKEMSKKLERGR